MFFEFGADNRNTAILLGLHKGIYKVLYQKKIKIKNFKSLQ